MSTWSSRIPVDITAKKAQLLADFSSDSDVLAEALAQKRFGRCEACGRWDYLVVHHWWEKGDYRDLKSVHLREVCYSCNNELPSDGGCHILGSWEEQLRVIRGWFDPDLDTVTMSVSEVALRRELAVSRRDEAREIAYQKRIGGVERALDHLRGHLQGTPLLQSLEVVEAVFAEELL